MGFQELFSKLKQKRQKADQPVIFKYDEIPEEFLHQVVHIWMDAIGPYNRYTSGKVVWDNIHNIVSRELGLPALGKRANSPENCIQFLFERDTDHVLDLIQVSFNAIEHYFGMYKGDPEWMQRQVGLSFPPDLAIQELNHRFLEHDIGYQYQDGRIVRIDSLFTHSEIILPALQLLNDRKFKPALDEFLQAHEHYRHGRYESAINESLKAFESTMKIIIAGKGWTVNSNATSSKLIQICIENNLFPSALSSHFTGLRTTLEGGLPTLRNRYAGHGDGVSSVDVPDYFAQYALNLAATNIVLLIRAYLV